jgi:hypothetical protein
MLGIKTATAICFLLLSSSFAMAQSAGEMLNACEILERGMHIEGESVFIPAAPDVNQCWGFMKAVQQYASLADQDGKTLLGACPDQDTKSTQIVRVFVAYAHQHPEKLSLKAAAVAYNAMADAFPCKATETGH